MAASLGLRVTVVKAEGLPNVESGLLSKSRESDPYCVLLFRDKKFKTKVIDNNCNPEWNETIDIPLSAPIDGSSKMTVEVYDHEKIGPARLLGTVEIPLAMLMRANTFQNAFPLQKKGKPAGKISLAFEYSGPPPSAAAAAAAGSSNSGVVGSAADASPEDAQVDEEEEAAEEVIEITNADGTKQTIRRPRIGGKKRVRRRAAILSSKPADYQVRVHVIEAKNLQGGKVDPVVKVTVANQKRQTRVQKTNVSPYYDEYMVFNFHESPAKLFEESIVLQVYNARAMRKDALIGSFTLDIGMVYEEDKHMFPRTWMMLTNVDRGDSAVMGFLKCTLAVLGPGDEYVVPDVLEDEDENIEDRVLRPAGAELETVDLAVRIYSAEDIPQKDPSFRTGVRVIDRITGEGTKQNCDPYVRVQFGGKRAMSKVIENSYYPEWNEELHLPMQVPSMTDRIRIQVWDSDTIAFLARLQNDVINSGDDVIATTFLNLSEISNVDLDRGFLPTFGPAYVNLYGGPREFSLAYDNHYKRLDHGVGEGFEFRGRVLLELNTQPVGENGAIAPGGDISPEDLDRLTFLIKKREYLLRVAFVDVGLLDGRQFNKGQLSLEVSLGTVGNVECLPKGENPFTSLTFPSLPSFDGVHYYFLAWDNKKPCLEFTSQWEDVMFRLYSLNLFKHILRTLDTNVKAVEAARMLENDDEKDMAEARGREAVLTLLDMLIAGCERPMVPLPDKQSTRLDVLMYERRQDVRATVVAQARDLKVALQSNAKTVDEALDDVGYMRRRLAEVAVEPQSSIPDLIIWLMHDGERVAYYRAPIADFLYASDPMLSGELFGQAQSVFLRSPRPSPSRATQDIMPGRIQFRAWFGPSEEQRNWPLFDARLLLLLETWENQRHIPAKGWGDLLLPTDPPKWSDREGKEKRDKADFKLPDGWTFHGDWYIDPSLPTLDVYGDQESVIVEVYENERKQPIKGWCKILNPADPPAWSDSSGSEERTKDSVTLPAGWKWAGDWKIDMNRAVDNDGWEYAFDFGSTPHPGPKMFDFVRRRRWVIERVIDPDYKGSREMTASATDHGEGWEYALRFGQQGRPKMNKLDLVRRRRWHREIVANMRGPTRPTLASVLDTVSPAGSFLAYAHKQVYQLRAHIYQARELPGEDKSALSDPFVRVSFGNACVQSTIKEQTITPTWDETLIIDNLTLYGNHSDPRELFAELNPTIVIEVFDYDMFGGDDFLGRAVATPTFRSRKEDAPAVLEWVALTRAGEYSGDVLAAFELIPIDDRDAFPLPKKKTIKEPLTGKKRNTISVPVDIRPELQRCRVDILTWGVRDLQKVQLLQVTRPFVEFECGGITRQTEVIKRYRELPNFSSKTISLELDLPVKDNYAPPLNIRVFDHRKFGRKPLVGAASIKSLGEYRRHTEQSFLALLARMRTDPPSAAELHAARTAAAEAAEALPPGEQPGRSSRDSTAIEMADIGGKALELFRKVIHMEEKQRRREVIDWWSKFYYSVGGSEADLAGSYNGDRLVIYKDELEQFIPLDDIVVPFKLHRGRKDSPNYTESGVFKGNFRVTVLGPPKSPLDATIEQAERIADDDEQDAMTPLKPSVAQSSSDALMQRSLLLDIDPWDTLPDKTSVEVVVRVYVVRGLNLAPRDDNGKSDPYLVLQVGRQKPVSDRDNYIARNLNPVFGRMFEFECVLPRDASLLVQVFDWDMISKDDLIGQTTIDLETRWLSSRRANVGLGSSYTTEGVNAWRDSQKPSEILAGFCQRMKLSEPIYSTDPISVGIKELNGGQPFVPGEEHQKKGGEIARETAALMALHACGLIKEHIETRTLYDPMQPDMDQGKLQMWVDVFEKAAGLVPPPVDISPRAAVPYELRVVIYDTVDVVFKDVAVTGEEMSDIYVSGMLRGMEKIKQKTDVHYRSLNGEGNFNWRMVFPFQYLEAEEMLVTEHRPHIFSKEREIQKLPPVLSLQIWDADVFKSDEFIGSIEINLNKLVMPARKSSGATGNNKVTGHSIFDKKRVRGWYAVVDGQKDGKPNVTGRVDVEIEVLTAEEAAARPAGKARDPPNQFPELPPPNRPATSFFWFTNPLKSFRFIVWKNYKWWIIGVSLLILIALLIVVFIYTAPASLMDAIVLRMNQAGQSITDGFNQAFGGGTPAPTAAPTAAT